MIRTAIISMLASFVLIGVSTINLVSYRTRNDVRRRCHDYGYACDSTRRQLPNLGSFASLKFSDRTPPCRSIAVRATAQVARQRAADQLTPAPEREEAGL